jgi:hypothetical protein
MKKLFLSLILVGLCLPLLYAQKESYNWYFGYQAALTWDTKQDAYGLTGLPTPIPTPPASAMNQMEGVLTMSDANGKLLFYSGGTTIWNKNHQIMTNGDNLLGDDHSTQSGSYSIYRASKSVSCVYCYTGR